MEALTARADLAAWNGELEHAHRLMQEALAVDPTSKATAEQIERIGYYSKLLSHARVQLVIPMAIVLILFSVCSGYFARDLSSQLYALLFIQVGLLMVAAIVGAAIVWSRGRGERGTNE